MQFDLLDSTHNDILSSQTYDEFSRRLKDSQCKRCTLCEIRDKIVIDRGNPNSSLMIISERPGENENREGKAFVGRAGELLNKIFSAIGLDSNKGMLICNVVKCMPPTDRSPHSPEVEACLPYLEKQIDLMKPKIIILLGLVALKFMSNEHSDFTMEKEAGKFFTISRFPGVQFMVLYHPAFLLRDPRKKKVMWDHVKSLRDYMKQNDLMN